MLFTKALNYLWSERRQILTVKTSNVMVAALKMVAIAEKKLILFS